MGGAIGLAPCPVSFLRLVEKPRLARAFVGAAPLPVDRGRARW